MKWRLIIDKESKTASENMSIDLALQKLCKQPVLRLYSWNPPSISIGRFQCIEKEVNQELCKKKGVNVIRRVTGGGAVFHDKELTYSVCIKEENEYFSKDLLKSYKEICGCIIKGLSFLGIKAEYEPINDLIVNDRKISGCAQTRKKKILLHHGTILIEVDIKKMFSLLKVPEEKLKDKLITNVEKRVTSLKKELKIKIKIERLEEAIKKGFEETLNITFKKSELTKKEIELAKKLQKEKFDRKEWNNER